MKRNNTFFIFIILSALTAINLKGQTMKNADEIKEFIKGGKWESLTVELRPAEDRTGTGKVISFLITRCFEYFENNKFSGTITSFADNYGKIPLVRFVFKGHVVWQGEHPVAEGAQKIDYILDEGFLVTPLNQDFAAMLNSVPVPELNKWELNVTQDILGKPFPLFNIKKGEIAKDHDLIYIYNGMLFMGAKHVDGTPFDKPENRPHQLQVPLVRK